MKSGRRKLIGFIGVHAIALVCGLGGYASLADAQTAESRVGGRSSVGGSATLRAADAASQKLQKQVAAALQADPYLDDEHINISAERGIVVLSGLVFDDWDLRAALRTAREAAGHRPVIDRLSIEEGGR
jgi:osmotically-inducible protein OsmY